MSSAKLAKDKVSALKKLSRTRDMQASELRQLEEHKASA
jgi:hypothetical protein